MSEKRKRYPDCHDSGFRVKQEFSSPAKRRHDLIPLNVLLVMIDEVIDKMDTKAQQERSTASNQEQSSTSGGGDINNVTEPSGQVGIDNVVNGHLDAIQNDTTLNDESDNQSVSQEPEMATETSNGYQPKLKPDPDAPVQQQEQNAQNPSATTDNHAKAQNGHGLNGPDSTSQETDHQQATVKTEVKLEPVVLKQEPFVMDYGVIQQIKLEVKQEMKYSAVNGHNGSTNGTNSSTNGTNGSTNGTNDQPPEQQNDLMTSSQDQDPSIEQAVSRLLQDDILVKFE